MDLSELGTDGPTEAGSVCVCSVFLMAFGDVEKWRGKIGGIHYY